MQRWAAWLIAFGVAIQGMSVRAAEPAKEMPYTFSINGKPFAPRVFSLRGDPEHPQPGDLIALGELLLTLGPERDCPFIIPVEKRYWSDFDKVLLRLPNGKQRIVGVRIFYKNRQFRQDFINPLKKLSEDEIHGLWGVYLNAWPDEVAQKLQHLEFARACITVDAGATVPLGEKEAFPPLPKDIQYLCLHAGREISDFGILRQWPQLRFLSIEVWGKCFDAKWLAQNRLLRRLDLGKCRIEHPEALTQLERLECLDLSGTPNLLDVDFTENMPSLKSLDVSDTAVQYVASLENLRKLNVSNTRVRDISCLRRSKNLEELDISETIVRDLSPLCQLKNLQKVTATNSSLEKLPNWPMPGMRNVTAFWTPLSRAAADTFMKQNSKCAVILNRTEAFRAAVEGTTRIRIRLGGAHCSGFYELMPFLYPCKMIMEITDAKRIGEILQVIEVVAFADDLHVGDFGTNGDPTFELYRGDTPVGAMNWKYGMGFGWPGQLTPQSLERLTKRLAEYGYDELWKQRVRQLAHEKIAAEQEMAMLRCYPETIRKLIGQFAGNEDALNDEDEYDRGYESNKNAKDKKKTDDTFDGRAQIAKAMGDPVELAVATLRAVGAVEPDLSVVEGMPVYRLIVGVGHKVSDDDFLKALEKFRGDRQVELGAARLYFHKSAAYEDRIPKSQEEHWAAVLLNHGDGKFLFNDFGYSDPRFASFLRKIARGELGRDGKLEEDEVGLRADVCLALAEKGVADIKPEIEALLPKTTRKADIAALEIALALLGDPKYLKPEHLKFDTPLYGKVLRAIKRFNGRAGLDILVEAGFDNSNDAFQKESLELFQEITGQHWYDDGMDADPRRFIPEARKWWRDHGPEFVARRRAEK